MLDSNYKTLLAGGGISLAYRFAGIAVVLILEKSLLNLFVDFDAADAAAGFPEIVRATQHFGLRFLVTVALALALFALVSGNERLTEINLGARGTPLRWQWVAAHVLFLGALVPVLASLYHNGAPAPHFALDALLIVPLSAGAFVTLFGASARLNVWYSAARTLGILWAYALSAAIAATLAIEAAQALWSPMAGLTYQIVWWLLSPFLPDLHADPTSLVLSTSRFAVEISDECSGLEGMGLMLAFCCAWLVYFRREYRFPRSLLLIPAGLLVVFVLNFLRIAALTLLGDAGYPEVARVGFHSQAGWIAFNIAACGVAVASRHIRWLIRGDFIASQVRHTENPTANYLMPFLAVLAAGMVARATSDGFETLYSLRLLAGGTALWICWKRVQGLDWHFTWRGPVVGLVVFALWIAGDRLAGNAAAIPEQLAAASPALRMLWIAGRFATAVLLVPVAEELAYRGYLLRRLASADFESVRFNELGWIPLLISSIVFGLGHGVMSVAGFLAGLIYGGLLMRTGRFGEAVIAHSTTNLLVALYVLVFDQWQLW